MSQRKRSCHLDYAQYTVQRLYKPHQSRSQRSKRKRHTKRDHHKHSPFRTEEANQMVKQSSHRTLRKSTLQTKNKGKHRHSKHIHSRSSIDHQYYKAKPHNGQYDASDDDTPRNNIQSMITSVRREYQQQVDHVISKWKELLDRAQIESAKYRDIVHTERSRNKKMQQTVDQLRSKLKKYKNKDIENNIVIIDLQQKLAALYDNLTEITTPSQTPRSMCYPKNTKNRVSNDSYYDYSKQRRNSLYKTQLKLSLPPPNNTLRNDDKMVKTRDDLKEILDRMDDNKEDGTMNKCISLCIKYKDKLFKNKSNTIKVHQTMRLNEFIHHLSDSININPNLIQIQHDTNIIDINNEKTMNSSLAQLDIDNFDHILVYIDYNKLLQNGDDDNDDDNDCEMKNIIEKMEQYIDNNNAKNMLLLKSSIHSLYQYIVRMQHKERLCSIIMDCILENDANLMLELLSAKIAEIIKCQHVRLYFKWNNIVQIIYPQNTNITQQIIINLNDDSHDNKSLLMDILMDNSMKCYNNPSQSNSNFNSIFNKQFNYNVDSTLIAPLFFDDKELIGIIQLINKENTNNFEFTMNDKELLFPFTDIFGIALKILYNILSNNNIFNQLHSITRVNRGVSRKILQSDRPRPSDDESYLLRHNSISRNASPHYDNLSITSSSFYDPIEDKKKKRGRKGSRQYYINHREQNTIVVNIGNRQNHLVTPPTPSQHYNKYI